MSYELVKSIQIVDGKVFIASASNNVYPRTYKPQEQPYFTKILAEKGADALTLALLHEYESGNCQPGNKNKYSRAIERLRTMPEYKPFDWRKGGGWDVYEATTAHREANAADLDALLLKAFNG